ncbi:MAG: hypothetical protein R3C42_03360 [Parvularculaceae bacterium]
MAENDRRSGQQTFDHLRLAASKAFLAMAFEQFSHRHPRRRLDFRVGVTAGRSSALASLRPTVVLPAPIMPTSAIGRSILSGRWLDLRLGPGI